MNEIAFYDFDGTVTKNDTLLHFIKHYVGDFRYYSGLLGLSPILIGYKLKLIDNSIAKQIVLKHFFYKEDEQKFNKKAEEFSLFQMPNLLRPKAMESIDSHLAKNVKVVIVSASLENWLKPWCDSLGVELLATKVSFISNEFQGDYQPKNCYGNEKVRRIKEAYDLARYDKIYAYGDTSGDLPMLKLADESFYKPFQ